MVRRGLVVLSAVCAVARRYSTEAERLDHSDADRAIASFCQSDVVRCKRSLTGELQTKAGAFGKVVFGEIANSGNVRLYAACPFRPDDRKADRDVDCTRSSRLQQPLVSFAFKVPLTRSMGVDLSDRHAENTWWREKRTLRKMGRLGLSPKILDLMRESSGGLKPHPSVYPRGMLMEYLDGVNMARLVGSLSEEIETVTPAEAWIRLRALTLAALLHADFLGRMWDHPLTLRHCDAHWGNFMITKVNLTREQLSRGVRDGSVIALGSVAPVSLTGSVRSIQGDVYSLSPKHMSGLDVSYTIKLNGSSRYQKLGTNMSNPCVYYANRPDDLVELYRSLAAAAADLKSTEKLVTGAKAKMLREVRSAWLRMLATPTLTSCVRLSTRLWKQFAAKKRTAGSLAARELVGQEGNACTLQREAVARNHIVKELIAIVAMLDKQMPSSLARDFHPRLPQLSPQGLLQ
ncbi:MAG: hypothetical protein KVP17_001005 [Porospora cf. gigantea B]|uniref:uncharacterized protein n=1 Tax=Porospora cf. gigantea B TaxID=2853592 RepID=UPI003571DAC8|nr:MAG: hypothetical protein KVP17_001005 [Porospora cf. gigantea B]